MIGNKKKFRTSRKENRSDVTKLSGKVLNALIKETFFDRGGTVSGITGSVIWVAALLWVPEDFLNTDLCFREKSKITESTPDSGINKHACLEKGTFSGLRF